MKIVSKSKAASLGILSNKIVTVTNFDGGKYKGDSSDYYGRDVQDIRGVIAVFPVTRYDDDGKYISLKCVCEARFTI